MYLPKNLNYEPATGERVRAIRPDPKWYIGLDLGQRRDYSAFACLELTWRNLGRCPVTFGWKFAPALALLSLDRFPLGTDYEDIPRMLALRVQQIDAVPRPYGEPAPAKDIVIDGGGPGPPVIDRIRRKMNKLVHVRPVLITSGQGQNSLTGGYTGVPRRTLISDVLLLLANRTLELPPDLDEGEALAEEFAGLTAATSQPASAAAHDDLVMALALGAWAALSDAPELLPG